MKTRKESITVWGLNKNHSGWCHSGTTLGTKTRVEVAPDVAAGHHMDFGGLQAKEITRTESGDLPLLRVERGGNEQRELRDMVKKGGGKAGESGSSEREWSVSRRTGPSECDGISHGVNTGKAVVIWSFPAGVFMKTGFERQLDR